MLSAICDYGILKSKEREGAELIETPPLLNLIEVSK
jgi:hypothetical protein